MIAVTVTFEIDPEHVQAFREAVLQQAKNSLTNEEACRQFDVSVHPEQSNRFFLYELYDDDAAFERHRQTEYFAQFFATVDPWIRDKDLNVWNIATPEG